MLLDEQVISGEKQLKEYSSFLQHHQYILNNIVCQNLSIPASYEKNDGNIGFILTCSDKDTLRLQQSLSIGINFSQTAECISTMDLIQSDNRCLNKTIAVFVQLCMEVRELCNDGSHLLSKCLIANEEICLISPKKCVENIVFPVATSKDKISLSTTIVSKITSYLGLFHEAQQFIERCFIVISEIIKQLTCLFDANNSNYINVDYSSLHSQTVFTYLAEAVVLIVKFDSIFQASQLRNIWPQYINTIKFAEQNINTFGESNKSSYRDKTFTTNDVSCLKNVLINISYLFTGCLYQNLLDSIYSHQNHDQAAIQALSRINLQFHTFLRNNLNVLQKYHGRNYSNSFMTGIANTFHGEDLSNDMLLNLIDEIVPDLSLQIVKLNGMCILYHHLFGNLDQKLFAAISDINKKFPCILLMENKIWSPEMFFNKYGSTLLVNNRGGSEKWSSEKLQRIHQQYLRVKCQQLSRDITFNTVQVAAWVLNFRNEFSNFITVRNHYQTSTSSNCVRMVDFYRKTLLILQV